MTYRELITRVKTDYENAYNHIKNISSHRKSYLYLIELSMHFGVCHSTTITYGVPIAHLNWVNARKEKGSPWWCKPPVNTKNTAELIESIRKRVVILEDLLKQENLSAEVAYLIPLDKMS